MNINELATLMGQRVVIRSNFECWQANFEHGEILEGRILGMEWGGGKTPQSALTAYCNQIAGKLLVFNAMSKDHRREFRVPNTLTAI